MWNEWLEANRGERMDAMSDLFNLTRREFHLARYNFALNYAQDLVIADVACGTGYGASLLATAASKVYGIDREEKAIDYARAHYNADHIFFIKALAHYMPILNNSLDLLVSFETIEHVEDGTLVLTEFHRALKNKGKLIISTPNNWGLSKYHKRTYTLENFKDLLSNSFLVEKIYNQNSGSKCFTNRKQPCGIIETNPKNKDLAECFIAVCIKK